MMQFDYRHVYTKADIIRQLEQMHCPKDRIVLMHSSYRAIGQVEGGAEGLLDILIDYFTEEGGLFCVPTHTWHNMDKEITLDMSSDDNCLGAMATVALRDGRGIRSENPIHSMVVFGDREKAINFMKDEANVVCTTGPDSCHGKICREGGFVLLVGVAHNRNTSIHAIEDTLGTFPRLSKNFRPVTVRRASGEIVKREIVMHSNEYRIDISTRYVKYETAFRYHRCITDGFLGNAPVQLCDARKMLDTVGLIFSNCGGKDPLGDERPIPQKWYCIK